MTEIGGRTATTITKAKDTVSVTMVLLLLLRQVSSSTAASLAGTAASRPAFVTARTTDGVAFPRRPRPFFSAIRQEVSYGSGDDGVDGDVGSESALNDMKSEAVDGILPRPRRSKNRFRQHVNPLARKYQAPTPLADDWYRNVFEHSPAGSGAPLIVDIGCAKGNFALEMAGSEREGVEWGGGPSYNHLGLEIRENCVEFAMERARRMDSKNVHYLQCNANVDLERILRSANVSLSGKEGGGVALTHVHIQFPDPHFKKAHAKRKVVTEELVQTIALFMAEGSSVFLQSDIQDVLDDMRSRFRATPWFNDISTDPLEYLGFNPTGVPTEREISVLKKGLEVYRTVMIRNKVEAASI